MVPVLTPQFELAIACAVIGALLMVLSNLMKRMVALRCSRFSPTRSS